MNDRERKRRRGSIGSALRASQATKRASRTAPTTNEPTIVGLRPAELVRPDETPHDGEQAAAGEPQAGQVEPGRRAVGLGQAERGQRDRDEPDRDVDPEDPLPGEALGDRPADERPDRDREAGDAAPRAERDGASLARHGGRQDRQAQRREDRAAETLDGAGDDQRA